MRNPILGLVRGIVLAAAVATLAGCNKPAGDAPSAAASMTATSRPKFHCPMHPTYVSDRMGDCPICNMKLVPIKASTEQQQGHGMANADSTAADRSTITLSAEKRQLIGLTLAKVEERELALTVRATGVVKHDETRFARIAPRFGGWVRRLDVNFTGAPVEKGQPLFTVYSPEIFATESDYLIAWQAVQQLRDSTPSPQRASAQALLEAARLRLALLEVDDGEIRALEQRGTASQELIYRAPFSGHVLTKSAVDGKAFMAGEALYEISDLSHLWLRATVAGADLALLAVGQEATVGFPDLGNLILTAPIAFLEPHLDAQTRRGSVRIELVNPGLYLRPEMWADVEIEVPLGNKLTIPAAAVIDTGKRQVAFVAAAGERLEPRVLKIGAKTDDFYEVRGGVKAGEQVVARALFLVDSESQLQAAISGMTSADGHAH